MESGPLAPVEHPSKRARGAGRGKTRVDDLAELLEVLGRTARELKLSKRSPDLLGLGG